MDTLRIDKNGRGIWLGETHVPWATVDERTDFQTSIHMIHWRRAQIRFENSLGLSLIWGSATHCVNYGLDDPWIEEPPDMEVMVLRQDGVIADQLGDNEYKWPCGWVTIPELLRLMNETMKLPSDTVILPEDFFPRDNER